VAPFCGRFLFGGYGALSLNLAIEVPLPVAACPGRLSPSNGQRQHRTSRPPAALGPGLDRESSSPCSLKTLGEETTLGVGRWLRPTLCCEFKISGIFRNRHGCLRLLAFSPCGSTLQLICGEQWHPPCSGRACTRFCYPSERPEMFRRASDNDASQCSVTNLSFHSSSVGG
jgi:hypothetical protein